MQISLMLALTAAFAATVQAADCNLTQLTPFLADPNFETCATDSGFSLTSLAVPSKTVMAKMCTSDACMTLISEIEALGMGDCSLEGIQIESDFLDPLNAVCSGSSVSSGSSSSDADVTVPETESNSTGSSGDDEVVSPDSSSSSAASSIALATGAVAGVVAVVAALN